MADNDDLLLYRNGKQVSSPWRYAVAIALMDAEYAVEKFCSNAPAMPDTLDVAVTRLNRILSSPTKRHRQWSLKKTDAWTLHLNERLTTLQARVALLESAGQL